MTYVDNEPCCLCGTQIAYSTTCPCEETLTMTEAELNAHYGVNINNPAPGFLDRAERALDDMFDADAYCCRAGVNAAPGPCPWHDPRVAALADYLGSKVGRTAIPIGTRVAVRSFKGSIGTVVGPDGHPRGSALAVRMDPPYPTGYPDGYACVSVDECSVIATASVKETT